MRLTIFSLIFLSVSMCVAAQTVQKIRLRTMNFGRVSVTKGNLRSTINLSKDVAGCSYISGKGKRGLDKEGCAAPPATFKLIDATIKNNQTFLVVKSDAMGNCNVCGRCGASESFTLIWVKLDSRLRVANKQSVPVDDCTAEVSSRQVKQNENNNLSNLRLAFKRDILTVEFEKTIYNNNADISSYEFSSLEYNRKTPEKGFVIKTEKREKPSISE